MAAKRKNNTSSKLTVIISLIIISFLLFTINKQKEQIKQSNLKSNAADKKIAELKEVIENINQGKTLKLLEVEKKYIADIEKIKAEVDKQKITIKELKEQTAAFDQANSELKEQKQTLEIQLEEEKQKTKAAIAALNGPTKDTASKTATDV